MAGVYRRSEKFWFRGYLVGFNDEERIALEGIKGKDPHLLEMNELLFVIRRKGLYEGNRVVESSSSMNRR
jgi:hypothetical protein